MTDKREADKSRQKQPCSRDTPRPISYGRGQPLSTHKFSSMLRTVLATTFKSQTVKPYIHNFQSVSLLEHPCTLPKPIWGMETAEDGR